MIPAVEIQQIYIINGSGSLPTAFPSASWEYNFQNLKRVLTLLEVKIFSTLIVKYL